MLNAGYSFALGLSNSIAIVFFTVHASCTRPRESAAGRLLPALRRATPRPSAPRCPAPPWRHARNAKLGFFVSTVAPRPSRALHSQAGRSMSLQRILRRCILAAQAASAAGLALASGDQPFHGTASWRKRSAASSPTILFKLVWPPRVRLIKYERAFCLRVVYISCVYTPLTSGRTEQGRG